MASFLSAIAAPAVRQVSEQRLLGKPFVRLGKLFIVVGYWVYQQGGVLGYGLKGHPALLGKLLPRVDPEQAAKYVASLHEVVTAHLAESEGQEKTFFHLYIIREFRGLGVDITAWPPSKVLYKKVSPEMTSDTMVMSFIEGAALGYHFPELFKEYWDNTYRKRPDSEWQGLRARGIILSEVQQTLSLSAAISNIAEMAHLWAAEEAPQLLDSHEVQLLKRLAISAEGLG